MLQEGATFPEFALQNQDGQTVRRSDYAGNWLIVYFYPKDDTPGCTIQGKSFTATKDEFAAAGVSVVGVSQDDVESHKNFCNKFNFTVDLLADPDATLMSAAGLGQKEFRGNLYWDRTTFLIDPDGTIRKVYANVNPEGHERTLLEDVEKLKAA